MPRSLTLELFSINLADASVERHDVQPAVPGTSGAVQGDLREVFPQDAEVRSEPGRRSLLRHALGLQANQVVPETITVAGDHGTKYKRHVALVDCDRRLQMYLSPFTHLYLHRFYLWQCYEIIRRLMQVVLEYPRPTLPCNY
ncbi:hypothetical protein CYMTET_11237 [Cymbomonas tetramitiformis]|uniref:Uncharacterized protein n=1 Tax=Cymbomonas tetramitiformis TaxID=36881 RepID=A0AAE0GMQ0_9CHLO|nr:hypothetical protein CYMTET_11237 [Cymbomonas tetramitiformis]